MNQDIKFSVTVPAYKAQFLGECIDSILAQTYKNFEVIIVNDASPQDLDSIVKRYDDPRIHYYKNKVGFGAEHVVGNWNKCLEYATGDYLICMGDDDKLLPNCLGEYVKLMGQYPNLDVYHAMTLMIDENSKVIGVQSPRPIYESMLSMVYYRWFGIGRPQYIGDWLFKTKTLKKEGGFVDLPYAWESDDISACRAAVLKGIANMQVPGFLYRINSQTITSNTSNTGKKLESRIKALKIYKQIIEGNRPIVEPDIFYYENIKNGYMKHLAKGQVIDISSDMSNNILKIVGWWLKRNRYKISSSTLIKALLFSITEKYHNRQLKNTTNRK